VGPTGPFDPKIPSCSPAGRLQDKLINPNNKIIPVKIKVIFLFWKGNMGQLPFSISTRCGGKILGKEIITARSINPLPAIH
jgi:hypothetical protein